MTETDSQSGEDVTETESTDVTAYVDDANDEFADTYEEPISLEAYLERIFEQPSLAAGSAKYLLDAIEHAGTRTVIEEGEETQRYCFFDDPWNDGESAILGNTDVLNEFVEDLRTIAAGRGKEEKILWVVGPTGTGKSELKRCLVNGLREYSKTDAGRRYTLEWSPSGSRAPGRGMTYGTDDTTGSDGWHESPVQSHPLSVFPDDVRETIVRDLNDQLDDETCIAVDTELDPFCREYRHNLVNEYRDTGSEDLFSDVTDTAHCRVTNYVVDVGRGIGVLHAEDAGTVKERLVGSWMPSMFEKTDSRGRKNPRAFSYDGVLSQGNGLLTIIEEAGIHSDVHPDTLVEFDALLVRDVQEV